MIKILLSEPDGSLTVMTISPILENMQALVGGYIEGVRLPSGAYAYVNEDGLGLGLPINEVASNLAGTYIVGPMVIFGPAQGNGIETDVPDTLLESLTLMGFVIMEEDS